MHMHRIVVESSSGGWLVRRPGWPGEWLEDRGWAERLAESLAHEHHAASGQPACAVLDDGAVLATFA